MNLPLRSLLTAIDRADSLWLTYSGHTFRPAAWEAPVVSPVVSEDRLDVQYCFGVPYTIPGLIRMEGRVECDAPEGTMIGIEMRAGEEVVLRCQGYVIAAGADGMVRWVADGPVGVCACGPEADEPLTVEG